MYGGNYSSYVMIRDNLELTDSAVEAAAGIPSGVLEDWKARAEEDPLAKIQTAYLVRIARLFEISLDDLM